MRSWIVLFFLLSACIPARIESTQIPVLSSPTRPASGGTATQKAFIPTQTASAGPEQTQFSQATDTPVGPIQAVSEPSPTPRPTLGVNDWQKMPVIPAVSEGVVEIYQKGLALGNNPNAFSKVGDCESTPTWFLGTFDLGESYYRLGPYMSLENVIKNFQGSFNRTSLAARRGFKASSALTPLWADHTLCFKNETPLACEYRLHRPILAFIMLGTNDVYQQNTFESQMRLIIEYSISQGVIPILATKADNLEGDGSINAIITQLAWEYDIPLWNFWLAVQPLPDKGLQADGSHLTWAQNLFDEPKALENAWPVRNLTALQVLDTLWHVIVDQPIP